MKRLIWAMLIFLPLGTILNIVVAWICTLWSPISKPSTLVDLPDIRAFVSGLPDNQHVVTSRESGFGFIRFKCSWHVPGEANAIWHVQAGWPSLALSGQVSVDREIVGALFTPHWLYGMVDAPDRRPLPITPLARGFAINSVLWALLIAAIILGPGWLRILYRKHFDRCPACGYDLSGAAHDRCPECGLLVQVTGH